MDNNIRRKNIILSVVVVLVGILLAGGTYAYLTFSINVTNNVVNASTTCFDIDYLDTNQITGTMFPSAGPAKGINGKVSLKVKSSCDLDGIGNIYIHANSGTSTKFTTTMTAHCENPNTLETLKSYTTSSTCTSNNGIWVTNGTPLKYAIYDNDSATGQPIDVGYFNAIGSDLAVYKTFLINHTQKNYYIFLWLDGYLTDNTYTNLAFNGYVKADATQENKNITYSIPNMYQRVEYIEGTGTQYINTGVSLFSTSSHRILIDFMPTSLYNYNTIWGSSYDGNTFEAWIYSTGSLAGRYNSVLYGSNNTITNNTRYLIDFRRNSDGAMSKYLDNSFIGSGTAADKITDASFYLFLSGSDYGKYKLYDCTLYQDGKIVSKLIPCYRKSDGVVGVYDVVSSTFKVNNGTGTFTKGANVN